MTFTCYSPYARSTLSWIIGQTDYNLRQLLMEIEGHVFAEATHLTPAGSGFNSLADICSWFAVLN